jgi:hypothetical protein
MWISKVKKTKLKNVCKFVAKEKMFVNFFYGDSQCRDAVPSQCRSLRRELRRKKKKLTRWIAISVELPVVCIDLVAQYLLPPPFVLDVIQHFSQKNLNRICFVKSSPAATATDGYVLVRHRKRSYGFSFYPPHDRRSEYIPWGFTARDFVDMYMQEAHRCWDEPMFEADVLLCAKELRDFVDVYFETPPHSNNSIRN